MLQLKSEMDYFSLERKSISLYVFTDHDTNQIAFLHFYFKYWS